MHQTYYLLHGNTYLMCHWFFSKLFNQNLIVKSVANESKLVGTLTSWCYYIFNLEIFQFPLLRISLSRLSKQVQNFVIWKGQNVLFPFSGVGFVNAVFSALIFCAGIYAKDQVRHCFFKVYGHVLYLFWSLFENFAQLAVTSNFRICQYVPVVFVFKLRIYAMT